MKKFHVVLSLFLSLFILLQPCQLVLATESTDTANSSDVTVYHATATITSDTLNVRSGPSKDYDVIALLHSGATITITGKTDTNWYQILIDDKTGYVSGKYVSEPTELATQEEPAANSFFERFAFIGGSTFLILILIIILIVIVMVVTLLQVFKLTHNLHAETSAQDFNNFEDDDDDDDFEDDDFDDENDAYDDESSTEENDI